MVLNPMMKSPAWLALSGTAVKLLLHLMMLSGGNNGWGHRKEGGQLFLSERGAAAAIGVSRNTASRAFEELIELGFLRIVSAGHFHVKIRVATAWRLTFQPFPRNHQGPTNEWRDWRPGQNSRAQNLKATGSKIGRMSGKYAQMGAKSAPVELRNGEKPRRSLGSLVAPHLDIPRGCSASERDGIGWWGSDAGLKAQAATRLALIAWVRETLAAPVA